MIEFDTFVTLLGAGELNPADLENSLSLAPMLVAADGGATAALDAGHLPNAVIGDFDSLGIDARMQIPPDRLFQIAEQDSTDFEKALAHIAAPGILALGFTGRRSDHELAVWHGLLSCTGPRTIVVGDQDIVFLAPEDFTIQLPLDTRFSLFPMAPVTGCSEGLYWPINGLQFAPGHRIGTSNKTNAASVTLNLSAPVMLVILPKAHLKAAMTALF